MPFYSFLPKNKADLLSWRIYVRERALNDLDFRKDFLSMCAADIGFFAASLIWLHETRNIEGQALGRFPMYPDSDQVDVLAWLAESAGSIDITISKTRGIGLSYLICILLLWLWLFHGEQLEFAVVTKDETSLDLKDRPSSLMGKLDLLFSELPAWMKVDESGKPILERTVTKHKFQNSKNGNTIGGYVATDDKLRSGRYYIVVLDEAAFLPADVQRWIAAAHGTSNSIIWLSTFDGTSNMFYKISTDDSKNINIVRIETFWDANPRWAAGKYVSESGRITILDTTYTFHDYDFSHDDPGLPRSPQVDAAFNRPGADKQRVKEEIYGLAVKDSRKLYSRAVMDRVKETLRPSIWRGDILDGEWIEDDEGPIQLWTPPINLAGTYVVGADPSLGTASGASGGIAAIDIRTGSLVLTARFQELDQIGLAAKAVDICKMLVGPRGTGLARLIWESTGIGTAFTSEVARLRWPAVWYEAGKSVPGSHNTDRGEAWLLELGRAIASEYVIIKSKDAYNDLTAWEYDRNFNLIFASSNGHGDLGIAVALAWRAARERRQAVMDSGKAKQDKFQSEILDYEAAQRKRPWSARFDEPRRNKGAKWL